MERSRACGFGLGKLRHEGDKGLLFFRPSHGVLVLVVELVLEFFFYFHGGSFDGKVAFGFQESLLAPGALGCYESFTTKWYTLCT